MPPLPAECTSQDQRCGEFYAGGGKTVLKANHPILSGAALIRACNDSEALIPQIKQALRQRPRTTTVTQLDSVERHAALADVDRATAVGLVRLEFVPDLTRDLTTFPSASRDDDRPRSLRAEQPDKFQLTARLTFGDGHGHVHPGEIGTLDHPFRDPREVGIRHFADDQRDRRSVAPPG